MSNKNRKYRTGLIIEDVEMRHMVFSGFGQMHRDTALEVKGWARTAAKLSGGSASTAISRSLDKLGTVILAGLGEALSAFESRCAPYPQPRADRPAPGDADPGGGGAPSGSSSSTAAVVQSKKVFPDGRAGGPSSTAECESSPLSESVG